MIVIIPIQHTDKKFTFVRADLERINSTRDFFQQFFTCFNFRNILNSFKSEKDTDLYGQLLERKTGKIYDKLSNGQFHKILIFTGSFDFILPLDLLRLHGFIKFQNKFIAQKYVNL